MITGLGNMQILIREATEQDYLAHVSFGYRIGQPLFNSLSVAIEPGQKIGFVGYSGAGKTTFVNLLLRLIALKYTLDRINEMNFTIEGFYENYRIIGRDWLVLDYRVL